MPNWRRAHVPGGTYFFTVVTDQRQPVFTDHAARQLLGNLLRECRKQWPFGIHSIVLLPDHLHTIWTLPRADDRYSQRWAWIKGQFTKRWLAGGGAETRISTGRERDGRRGVWQPKFWEHCIEEDSTWKVMWMTSMTTPSSMGMFAAPQTGRGPASIAG